MKHIILILMANIFCVSGFAATSCFEISAPIEDIEDYYLKMDTLTYVHKVGLRGNRIELPKYVRPKITSASSATIGATHFYHGFWFYGVLNFAGIYTDSYCKNDENSGLLLIDATTVYGICDNDLVKVGSLSKVNCD